MQQLFDSVGPSLFITGLLALFFGFIVVSMAINLRRSQVTREAWSTVAMRSGLTFQPGNWVVVPSITGEYRRRALLMNTFKRGNSRSRITYTQVTLAVSNTRGGRLTLNPESILSGASRALGMQDVQVGSERFDKSFMVKSDPSEFAQSLLGDPMFQNGLLRLKDRSNFVLDLDGAGLTFTTSGVLRDGDHIISIYNIMSDLADRVEGDLRKPMS